MYLMAALLVVGFVCNLLVPRAERAASVAAVAEVSPVGTATAVIDWPVLAFRWAWVGVPLAWGVGQTVLKSLPLFGAT